MKSMFSALAVADTSGGAVTRMQKHVREHEERVARAVSFVQVRRLEQQFTRAFGITAAEMKAKVRA